MILLVDAGNSRIKWGWWGDGGWLDKGWLTNANADQLEHVWRAHRPEWVGVSCVAGEGMRFRIETALAGHATKVYWLRAAASGHGVENRYHRPETLGSDRYAALIACRQLGLAPCVVANAGTALTVDALSATGVFLGGSILPGMALMRQALAQGTAAVAAEAGDYRDFPCSTAEGVASGILTALAGAVTDMRGKLAAREGTAVTTVLSGGDAPSLAARLPFSTVIVEDLVLEGLLWLGRDLGVIGA